MRVHMQAAALLAAALSTAWPALAADPTPVQQARRSREATAALREVPARPTLAVKLGLAHDEDEAGAKGWTTPFDLTWTSASEVWGAEVSGDGYARQRDADGARAGGWTDVGVAAWWQPSKRVTLWAEWTAPTHGDVGSTSSAQALRGQYETPQSRDGWSALVQAAVSRANTPAEGASRYGQALTAWVGKSLGHGVTPGLSATRAWQGGAAGTTDLGLDVEFPLLGKTATFGAVRGISAGSRHTTLSFALKF